MFRFRSSNAAIFAIALLVLCLCHLNMSLAGDVPKPIPQTEKLSNPTKFPRPVKLLGYITRNGSSFALIDIDGQLIKLRQGEPKPLRIEGIDNLTQVLFEEPIDLENRSLTLGFPNAFDFLVCPLGAETSPVKKSDR